MDWTGVEADPVRRRAGEYLVDAITASGLGARALRATAAFMGDEATAQLPFLRTARDAVWYISAVSDASMALDARAPGIRMSDVIDVRLRQNAHLKPFVRRVMAYDILHPVQTIRRMQRTARVMHACVDEAREPSTAATLLLNIAYTAIVFRWLADTSPDDVRTRRLARRSMRWIGLS